ncbi:MAG: methyltransferase domain-containing protein [Alphaproteobacteria bacterium]|nr:methyltransferase domain-containing protein [Alphaproteobacteria bacterium]
MLSDAQFALIARQAKRRIGLALKPERLAVIDARLAPLARREGCACAGELIQATQERCDDLLWDAIVDALVDPSTNFFRDRDAWRALRDHGIANILRGRAANARLRIWSAGCATGQEPFSLAILLDELREEGQGATAEIIATDVSARLIDKASAGIFSQFEVQRGLSVRRMIARFERIGDMWRVNDRVRAAVRFDAHNLLHEPAGMGPFDLVLCRNVLSGMDDEDRKATLERLAGSLAEDGMLMLGAEEDAADVTDAFSRTNETGLFLRNAYWRKAA